MASRAFSPRRRTGGHMAAAFGVGAALVFLAGCGAPTPSQQVQSYAEAVREALGRPGASEPAEGLRLPRRRERRMEVEDHRIGVLDFLSLQGCRLGELVGARNSQLGRVMLPSRRLVYELEVLEVGESCLEGLDADRREELRATLARKREELPRHVWNALWVESELERFLSLSSGPQIGGADGDELALLRSVATRLAEPARGAAWGEALEASLAGLRDEPSAAGAFQELAVFTRELDAVAGMLEGQAESPCRKRQARLAALFRDAYLPLQQGLGRTGRRVEALLEELEPVLQNSLALVPGAQPAMWEYARSAALEDPEGLWQRHRRALRRHVSAWAPTLRACGMLPGGPTTS